MPFPTADMVLSHILVVKDLQRSVAFYKDVLGASLYREYGGTTAVFDFNGAWLILVTGSKGTQDKPHVTMAPPADPDRVSHSMTIRVENCLRTYAALRGHGVEFLTPPVETEAEVRGFFRDPDGHLFEISEAKGA